MLYAMTFEQAQAYEPALLPAAVCAVVEPPLIASGERVKTAWTHVPNARRPRNKEKPPRIRKEKRLLRRRSLRLR